MNNISQGPRSEIISFDTSSPERLIPEPQNNWVNQRLKGLSRGLSFSTSSRELRHSMSCPDLKIPKKSNSLKKENDSPKSSIKTLAQKFFGKLSPRQEKKEKEVTLHPGKARSQPEMSSSRSPQLTVSKMRIPPLNLNDSLPSYQTIFREGEKYENFKEMWSRDYKHLTAKYKISFDDRTYKVNFTCSREEVESLINQTKEIIEIMIIEALEFNEIIKFEDFKLVLINFLEIINKKQ